MFCISCGKELPENAKFCPYCGSEININIEHEPQNNYENTAQEKKHNDISKLNIIEEDIDNNTEFSTAGDLLKVVGCNKEYFQKEFDNYEDTGKCKFNYAAFFGNIYYCMYRKMPELGKKYFLLPYVLLFIPALIAALITKVQIEYGMALISICITITLISELLLLIQSIRLGIHFNEEYYNHCKHILETGEISIENIGVSWRKVFSTFGLFCMCYLITCVIVGVAIMDEMRGIYEESDNVGNFANSDLYEYDESAYEDEFLSEKELRHEFTEYITAFGESEIDFYCRDFDNDGSLEAFASSYDSFEMAWEDGYANVRLCFINSNGVCETIYENGVDEYFSFGYNGGKIVRDSQNFFYVWENDAGGPSSSSHIFGVKDNHYYVTNLSNKVEWFSDVNSNEFSGATDEYGEMGGHEYIMHYYIFDDSSYKFIETRSELMDW